MASGFCLQRVPRLVGFILFFSSFFRPKTLPLVQVVLPLLGITMPDSRKNGTMVTSSMNDLNVRSGLLVAIIVTCYD